MKKILFILNSRKDLYLCSQIRNLSEKIDLDIIDMELEHNFAAYDGHSPIDELNKIIVSYLNKRQYKPVNIIANSILLRTFNLIRKAVSTNDYELILFSCYRNYVHLQTALALAIKEEYPDQRILLGGPEVQCSSSMIDKTLNFIDIETSKDTIFEAINEKLFNNNITKEELKNKKNMMLDFTEEEVKYCNGNLLISTSQGCFNSCRYCTTPNITKYKSIDLIEVVKWFEHYNKIGIKRIQVSDPTFNRRHFKEFIDGLIGINNKVKISGTDVSFDGFKCYSGIDFANIKSAGFDELSFGIECLNSDLALAMNRKMPKFKYILDIIHGLTSNNIIVRLFYIVGIPGQTESIFKDELEKLVFIQEKFGKKVFFEIYDFFVSGDSYIEKNYQKYNFKPVYYRPTGIDKNTELFDIMNQQIVTFERRDFSLLVKNMKEIHSKLENKIYVSTIIS